MNEKLKQDILNDVTGDLINLLKIHQELLFELDRRLTKIENESQQTEDEKNG